MKNYEIWRSELFDEIRTISHANELKGLWLGLNQNAISSFAEEVSHIFDDYDIDAFISATNKNSKMKAEHLDALCKFRDQFAIYVDHFRSIPLSSINPREILTDPQWNQIIKAAQEFINLLDTSK